MKNKQNVPQVNLDFCINKGDIGLKVKYIQERMQSPTKQKV